MAKFTAKLVKWGNSVGVSLPKSIRDGLDLRAGDEVGIINTSDTVIIKKVKEHDGSALS